VLLDMLALGTIVPVLPKLVVTFLNGDTAAAAEIYGLFGTAWALMQFLCSPLLGALSDRFGRRPVVLISNLGLGLDYILMALAPSLWWLFVGRVVSGITAASVSTGFAYVADVTPPEARAARFGMLGVAFGAGFVLGPALGGLAGGIDPRLPFWIAAGLSLTNALYGLFVLPESLPRDRRAPFEWRRANPLGSLALLRFHRELLGLASVNFLGQLAHAVLPSVTVLYMGYRYGWDERTVGLVMAGVGICSMVVQGALIGPVVRRFGERSVLTAGLLFGTVGFATYGVAATGTVFLIGVPLMALWGFANPAALGLMSRRVGPDEQGQVQGANGSIAGVANMIGPGLFTQVFAMAIRPESSWHLPGAPFGLAALMLLVAMVIAWRVTGEQEERIVSSE
jgi:DHA1 family tetracycline resistance protein-like MFS transporter